MELSDFFALCAGEHGLVVVATLRADSTIQSSLVNGGIVAHPVTGAEVFGLVIAGRVKLQNLRRRPTTALTARSGWQWATVEGTTEIVGPDDPTEGVDAERLRVLLRDIFSAAGGTHDDWEAYDAAMAAERRAAVLVHPTRIYSNART